MDKCSGELSGAQRLFLEGYNCAQSVFAANAPRFGIDKNLALRISMGMGAGVGRMRNVCGAFSACAMLAGLAQTSATSDKTQKEAVYEFVQKIAKDFAEQNGSIICREILNIAQGQKTSPRPDDRTAQYYAQRPCLAVVGNADKIASKISFCSGAGK